MEACHTAHYWAREIAALGHAVRPAAVRQTLRQEPEERMADAEAICEAVSVRRCGSC
jgi:transposase